MKDAVGLLALAAVTLAARAPLLALEEAGVEAANGVPRLTIDGVPTPPILFFFNTDIRKDKTDEYLAAQVSLAADAGIHLYSLPLRCPKLTDGITPNYEYSDALLERFVEHDPDAVFLLRVYPGPNWSWRGFAELGEEHFEWFLDGSRAKGRVSLGSDLAWAPTDEDLAELVRHFEGGPYAGRILGYQPGCPSHENFPLYYRERGPDTGPANTARFREWLRAKYRTDAALQEAWARRDTTLDSAQVPRCDPERFPMHMAPAGEKIQVFYALPEERDWVDFSEYTSDITADRLIRFARVVKRETDGSKLAAFFYGYTFELCGSFGGHFELRRLLECPDVDILASPYSYRDRFAGGAGHFMSPVDSISAHGKLWMNEDDTRTSVADMTQVDEGWALFEKTADDLDETLGVLDRNFASVLTHRAGTWWMDLTASGAFNHPDLWSMLRRRVERYADAYATPEPFAPDVAVLVHEGSKHFIKSDWDAHYWTMFELRDEAAKSGTSVGYYLVSDFIDGLVPECNAYVFANAFQLSDAEITGILGRLDREEATAIWIYAPGLIGPDGLDSERASRLTGMRLAIADGVQGSIGVGSLEGLKWGPALDLSPRLAVVDDRAEPVAHYASDGRVSSAQIAHGEHTSVFLGDMGPSADVLRGLFEAAGAHMFTRGGEVVLTDGRYVVVHVGEPGERTVYPRPGTRLRPMDADGEARAEPITLDFRRGETVVRSRVTRPA